MRMVGQSFILAGIFDVFIWWHLRKWQTYNFIFSFA